MSQKPSAPAVVVPRAHDAELGHIVTDEIVIAGRRFLLSRPAEPERLLSLESVVKAHEHDGYMPYWPTVWPVARYLAGYILQDTSLPADGSVLELGCGLGLPGLAALARGLEVTFTDYDETALEFVGRNAKLNGFERWATLPLDWRVPLPKAYSLILGSDLIYEAAFAPRVAEAFAAMLVPGGVGLLADQDRPYAAAFRSALTDAGLRWEASSFAVESEGPPVPGVLYRIFKPNT